MNLKIKKWFGSAERGEQVLRRELSVVYTGDRLEPAVNEYRRKLKRRYIAVTAVTLVCIAAASVYGIVSRKEISRIERPEPGSVSISMPLELEAEYKGKTVKEKVNINVGPVLRTDREKKQVLDEFAEELPDRIIEIVDGKRIVKGDLNLMSEDSETGIVLRWISSDPNLISEQGEVDVTCLEGENRSVELTAEMRLDELRRDISFEVTVTDDPEMYADSVRKSINGVEEQLSDIADGEHLQLPDSTSGGVKLKWKTRGNSFAPAAAVMGLAVLSAVYSGRYKRAEKLKKAYRQSVIAEFPNLVDKLVLFLNSGLTVYSALLRLSEEYGKNDCKAEASVRNEMRDIGRRVRNTNTSILEEWKAFAVRMESADMLRFCSILEENISKGGELCSKLENETELFMDMRRKNIQEQIRIIDSKMMIPMMLMLMSLILITISPVITGF